MKKQRRKITSYLILVVCLCMVPSMFLKGEAPVTDGKAYVVIIIDDFGNNMKGTKEILALPIPLDGAVIPGMPFATEEAKMLHDAGKEVMMHVPLEPEKGRKEWLGPLGITVGMSKKEVQEILEKGFLEVPYAMGMNNHMGSKAMKNPLIVGALMEFANQHQFYFVDSGTTADKVSSALATEFKVPFFKRNVFLDNIKDTEHVKAQLRELQEIAKTKGYAIGIGHVGEKGPYTSQALKQLIPLMQKEGITFVTMSELQNLLKEK